MANFSVLLLTALPPGSPAPTSGTHPGFVKVDGREVLLRSVELFLNRDNVKQVQLCFLPDHLDEGKRKFAAHLGFSGVKVLSGGPRWVDQIAAAADTIADDCTHVIVHDTARPGVPYSDIEALMEAAGKHAAATLAAPVANPLIEIDEGGNAMAIHLAGGFRQMLAPQVFSKARFEKIGKSKQEPHASEYALVAGSPLNMRVSSSADAGLAKAMLNLLPKPKIKGPSNPFEEAQW